MIGNTTRDSRPEHQLDARGIQGRGDLRGPAEPELALASSSYRARVCYHPATVRPGTIHHAEA